MHLLITVHASMGFRRTGVILVTEVYHSPEGSACTFACVERCVETFGSKYCTNTLLWAPFPLSRQKHTRGTRPYATRWKRQCHTLYITSRSIHTHTAYCSHVCIRFAVSDMIRGTLKPNLRYMCIDISIHEVIYTYRTPCSKRDRNFTRSLQINCLVLHGTTPGMYIVYRVLLTKFSISHNS